MKITNRKKHKLYLTFFALSVLLAAYIYINFSPPLSISSIRYSTLDESKKLIEIDNSGIVPVSLLQVVVNLEEVPIEVELGVSRFMNIQGFGYYEPHVSYHGIEEYKIKPISIEKKREKWEEIIETGEKDKILYYSIIINHDEPIKTITIKYSYFGIPLELNRDI